MDNTIREAIIRSVSQIPAICAFLVLVWMFQSDSQNRDVKIESLLTNSMERQEKAIEAIIENNQRMKDLAEQIQTVLEKK